MIRGHMSHANTVAPLQSQRWVGGRGAEGGGGRGGGVKVRGRQRMSAEDGRWEAGREEGEDGVESGMEGGAPFSLRVGG